MFITQERPRSNKHVTKLVVHKLYFFKSHWLIPDCATRLSPKNQTCPVRVQLQDTWNIPQSEGVICPRPQPFTRSRRCLRPQLSHPPSFLWKSMGSIIHAEWVDQIALTPCRGERDTSEFKSNQRLISRGMTGVHISHYLIILQLPQTYTRSTVWLLTGGGLLMTCDRSVVAMETMNI